MYGFYEEKPDIGTEYLTDLDDEDVVEDVYDYDEDEGAWNVLGDAQGAVQIRFEEGVWIQIA